MQYESDVIQLLQQAVNLSQKEISELLDIPPNENLGDIAFPCFKLSKVYKKSPQLISKELKDTIKIPQDSIFRELKAVGAFLNFFFDESKLAKNTLERIWVEENKYGFKYKKNEGKTIVIEFPAPNTNKPLHLGHLRNMALGESVSRVLESQGFRVVRVNLHNDRGIHICKSMLAYQKWGNNQEPNKKEDHFVGDFYVLFTKKEKEFPELEEDARNLLNKWEAKEPETFALWEKMTNWAEKGFAQTYKRFGVKFEKIYKESDLWEKGKEIIMEGLRKKLFHRDDKGNIVVDLEEPLDTKVLLRADGTSVYITQDIYLAKRKFDNYKSHKSIIITGNEQIYHFKVLFEVLKVLGYEFADGCYHLSHGMIYLPEGKMKSREGTVVDADDLLEELIKITNLEIASRDNVPELTVEKNAIEIAMAALKFYLLKIAPSKDFVFYPHKSISLYGKTGPYIQYSFVRANRILQKIDIKPSLDVDFNLLKETEEISLVKILKNYPEILEEVSKSYSPHILAEYSHKLAASFNLFYEKFRVIGEKNDQIQKSRLLLVKCFRDVIRNCLYMLGINTVNVM